MNNPPKPESEATHLEHDLAAFERLPEETKRQMKLKKQAAGSSGPEKVGVSRRIKGRNAPDRD